MLPYNVSSVLLLGAEACDFVAQVCPVTGGGQDGGDAVTLVKYLLPADRVISFEYEQVALILGTDMGDDTAEDRRQWEGLLAELRVQAVPFAVLALEDDAGVEGGLQLIIAGSPAALEDGVAEFNAMIPSAHRL
jgi:hypothetical protein